MFEIESGYILYGFTATGRKTLLGFGTLDKKLYSNITPESLSNAGVVTMERVYVAPNHYGDKGH